MNKTNNFSIAGESGGTFYVEERYVSEGKTIPTMFRRSYVKREDSKVFPCKITTEDLDTVRRFPTIQELVRGEVPPIIGMHSVKIHTVDKKVTTGEDAAELHHRGDINIAYTREYRTRERQNTEFIGEFNVNVKSLCVGYRLSNEDCDEIKKQILEEYERLNLFTPEIYFAFDILYCTQLPGILRKIDKLSEGTLSETSKQIALSYCEKNAKIRFPIIDKMAIEPV